MTHTGHKVDVAEDQHCDAEESDDVYIVVDELHSDGEAFLILI